MRVFLFPFIILGILFWALFALVIFYLPPKFEGQISIINIFYFFSTGAVATAFTLSLLIYFIQLSFGLPRQKRFPGHDIEQGVFRRSLRRGFLFALGLVVLGILKLSGLFNPFNVVLLVAIFILAEGYFSSR